MCGDPGQPPAAVTFKSDVTDYRRTRSRALPPRTPRLRVAPAVWGGGHGGEADLPLQSAWWPGWVHEGTLTPALPITWPRRALLQGHRIPPLSPRTASNPPEAPQHPCPWRGLGQEHLPLASCQLPACPAEWCPLSPRGANGPARGFVLSPGHSRRSRAQS